MGKKKILNDPIYGIISFPYDIIYDLIDHPYFQRLRRISQMGLSNYVYPGAIHSRFHHALGATHLMCKAITTLRSKGVAIEEDEAEAACIAILLHDIGHGPFSHALEFKLIPYHHEDISIAYMERLNKVFHGKLKKALDIFKGKYHKHFLHQLVSSQLDMDRMDYLIRDSYFTGVAEGVIGYDRIIKMLNVRNDQLVVEEKGIYSVEKFLMSRRLMYLQVYLHKTSIACEQMLIKLMALIKRKCNSLIEKCDQSNLLRLIKRGESLTIDECIKYHALLDDVDVMALIKSLKDSDDFLLKYYAESILDRKIFMIYLQDEEFNHDDLSSVRDRLQSLNFPLEYHTEIILTGQEDILEYRKTDNEILILRKDESIMKFGSISEYAGKSVNKRQYFLAYPGK